MFIANEKKQQNIVEYLLYMWQVENIIRVCGYSIEKILSTIILQQGLDKNQVELEKDWYQNLMSQMKSEGIEFEGHLASTKEILAELSFLHNSLLNELSNAEYKNDYTKTKADIEALRKKQKGMTKTDVEVCINGLYAFWMLKVSKQEVSDDTNQAMNRISKLMGRLSVHYKDLMLQKQ